MYGPAGLQVDAGKWQHESLREADSHRRGHSDSDYLNDMEHAHQRATVIRMVAATATVLVALAVIVLI